MDALNSILSLQIEAGARERDIREVITWLDDLDGEICLARGILHNRPYLKASLLSGSVRCLQCYRP